ncbi:hypothetical protein DVH05_025727 [Phytophthora capsici]|nr:hypothetical protein DVH05_025727 [Phytophthora capsici]
MKPVNKVVNCMVLGHGRPITVILPATANVDQLRNVIKKRKGLHRDSELDLYRAYDSVTNKWHTVTKERAHELGALTNQAEIMRAVASCNLMHPFYQLRSAELNLPEESDERIIHVLAVLSVKPSDKVINCIVLGRGEPITVILPATANVDQLRNTIKKRKGLHRDSVLDLYRAYNTVTNKYHRVTTERARELGALTTKAEIMRAVAGCNLMDPFYHLCSFRNYNLQESEEWTVHVLVVVSLVPTKVVNCIVLGNGIRGDIISVPLPAESEVDELRKRIKERKLLSRDNQLDLYRAYNTTTNKWLQVTIEDARTLGALTDQAEIARVVAGYVAIDPFLQLCNSKLDLPEVFEEGVVHVLAVVPAPLERK